MLLNDVGQPNVMISEDGHALLCDFGLSCLTTSTFSMTVDCPRRGSISWMAPEHLDSDLMLTSAMDVWAFGMTTLVCTRDLYFFDNSSSEFIQELFTHVPPFHPSLTMSSVLVKIL